MDKVISFSLWGADPLYWVGAFENIKLAKVLYPTWRCRFYIDEEVDKILLAEILATGCEVIFKKSKNALSGLLWRFLAADDSDVMISRDADSRLSLREVEAVNAWLNSDKDFHIMRDHPQHTALIPGGLWGCRNIAGINELIENFPVQLQDIKGHDQYFLAKYVYPHIRHTALIHDSYNLFGDSVDFPTPRKGNNFVGEVALI